MIDSGAMSIEERWECRQGLEKLTSRGLYRWAHMALDGSLWMAFLDRAYAARRAILARLKAILAHPQSDTDRFAIRAMARTRYRRTLLTLAIDLAGL